MHIFVSKLSKFLEVVDFSYLRETTDEQPSYKAAMIAPQSKIEINRIVEKTAHSKEYF